MNYLEAAEHFRVAAGLAPEEPPLARGDYLNRYAGALREYGDKRVENTILIQAIGIYRAALAILPHERVPLDWAMTQNNLGNALQRLGERESGTGPLEEAVAAYREALKE